MGLDSIQRFITTFKHCFLSKPKTMKILTTSILLFIVLFAKAQESKETILSQEEKIYGLSYIWQEVNYNFAYLNNYNLDWDSVYVSNIPKVIEAKS